MLSQADFLCWTDVDEHGMVLNYSESREMPFLVSVEIWNEESIGWLCGRDWYSMNIVFLGY